MDLCATAFAVGNSAAYAVDWDLVEKPRLLYSAHLGFLVFVECWLRGNLALTPLSEEALDLLNLPENSHASHQWKHHKFGALQH